MRYRKHFLVYTIIIAFSAVLAGVLYLGPRVKAEPSLIIFDVHANSPRIVKDDGSIEFSDYVRIRNMTDQPYDLTGLYLSDSRNDPDKLPLDGIVLEGGESQMVRLDPSWNFALGRTKNESVYLSDSKGNLLFKYSSKMKPKTPVLSANSGFYSSDFDLRMSVKGDYSIRYTLDGREPDEDSPEYTEPIRVYDRSDEANSVVNVPNITENYLSSSEKPIEQPVDKAFIIRAVAMDSYGNKSDIVTREYFFYGNNIIIFIPTEEILACYYVALVSI